MATQRVSDAVNINGLVFTRSYVREVDGHISKTAVVPAAKTGELTTRTNDTEGTLTMDTGHGIETGDRLDIYWSGGSRRGITVGTVAGDAVPLTDSGAGDNLPAAETAIIAMVPHEEAFPLNGALCVALGASSEDRGTIVFAESDDSEIHHVPFASSNGLPWDDESGEANPLGSDVVAKVFFSHSRTSGPCRLTVAANFD